MPTLEELILAYQKLSYLPEIAAEAVGVAAAEAAIERKYQGTIVKRLLIPIRGTEGPPIFDLVYEFKNGQVAIVECKFNTSRRGMVNELIFGADDISGSGAVEKLVLKGQVKQLDPRWIQQRINEVAEYEITLANKIGTAFQADKLIVLEARTIPAFKDGKLVGVKEVLFIDETEKIIRFRRLGLAGTGISNAKRTIEIKEAFARSAEAKAARARRVQRKAEANVIKAKKEGTRKRYQDIAESKLKEAERFESEAKAARQMAQKAADDIRPPHKQVKVTESGTLHDKKQVAPLSTEEIEHLRRTEPSMEDVQRDRRQAGSREKSAPRSEKVSDVPGSESTRAIDRGIGNTGVSKSGLKYTGAQEKGLNTYLAPAEQTLTTELKISRAARVFRLTKNLGTLIISLVVPISLLDVAFLMAIWILEMYQKRRAADSMEWSRIIKFLLGHSRPVQVDFVEGYVPGIGDIIENKINQNMFSPDFTNNFLYWLDKWDNEKGWVGFVYSNIKASLECQELVLEQEGEIRYYILGDPIIGFTSSLIVNNSKRNEPESHTYLPKDPKNKFTGGEANDPIQTGKALLREKEREERNYPYDSPEYQRWKEQKEVIEDKYAALVTKFNKSICKAKFLNVKYKVPIPTLTPFDFIIFKCRDLILEILRYISKYYESHFIPAPYDEESFWNIYWLEGVPFNDPINSHNAHICIQSLHSMIQTLSQHSPKYDNKTSHGTRRRLFLVRQIHSHAKGNQIIYRIIRGLRQLSKDEDERYLAKPIDPELQYINMDYLCSQAKKIEDDLNRVLGDLSNTSRSLLYNYNGSIEG